VAKSKPVRTLVASFAPKLDGSDDEALPTPDEIELEILTREWRSSPAQRLIFDWTVRAADLGFSPDDPDILRRCIKAGVKEFESMEAMGERVATYRALRSERRAAVGHAPVVYYMRIGNLVKIGTSRSIGARFAALNAEGIMAVEPGTADLEAERHALFADLHSHLEYFHLADPLAVHIVDVRVRFEAEMDMTTEEWLEPLLPKRRVPRRSTAA